MWRYCTIACSNKHLWPSSGANRCCSYWLLVRHFCTQVLLPWKALCRLAVGFESPEVFEEEFFAQRVAGREVNNKKSILKVYLFYWEYSMLFAIIHACESEKCVFATCSCRWLWHLKQIKWIVHFSHIVLEPKHLLYNWNIWIYFLNSAESLTGRSTSVFGTTAFLKVGLLAVFTDHYYIIHVCENKNIISCQMKAI